MIITTWDCPECPPKGYILGLELVLKHFTVKISPWRKLDYNQLISGNMTPQRKELSDTLVNVRSYRVVALLPVTLMYIPAAFSNLDLLLPCQVLPFFFCFYQSGSLVEIHSHSCEGGEVRASCTKEDLGNALLLPLQNLALSSSSWISFFPPI